MEFIKTYAILLATLLIALILLVIIILECFQKNQLIKWKLSLASVNIFVLILVSLFYEKVILVNDLFHTIFLIYISITFILFALMSFAVVNNCYQKSNDYTQFIESLNNTSWNVYFVCDRRDRIKEISLNKIIFFKILTLRECYKYRHVFRIISTKHNAFI